MLLSALVVLAGLLPDAAGQNIVENGEQETFERRALREAERAALDRGWKRGELIEAGARLPDDLRPLAQRLEREVAVLIEGWPWRPFFHQLGISGAETHFDHPDELFAVLVEALPALSAQTAERVRAFLRQQLREAPPFALEGYDRGVGQARERYDVPEALRAKGRGAARDAWGVYAFHAFAEVTNAAELRREHWPRIRERMRPLLEREYAFDPRKTDYRHDESERLNGDLAGLYATIHLARAEGDDATAAQAKEQAERLLQMRLDLERLNPRLLEQTDVATKKLHHFKLGRYLHLPTPVAEVLAEDGVAARRVRAFRGARPGWWMAFGDRLVGGENYTNSPDLGRAIAIAATQIERVSARTAASWADVPWCKADLYSIERLALILKSAQRR